MKKFFIFFFLILPLSVFAGNTCYVPKSCVMISSDFDIVLGEKPSYMMQVNCRLPDGMIRKYVSMELILHKIWHNNRIIIPRDIVFKQHGEGRLECVYDDEHNKKM